MGFSRQEHWSGLPFPPPGDLSDPEIKAASPSFPAPWADSLMPSHQGSPKYRVVSHIFGILKKDTSELIYKTDTDSQT